MKIYFSKADTDDNRVLYKDPGSGNHYYYKMEYFKHGVITIRDIAGRHISLDLEDINALEDAVLTMSELVEIGKYADARKADEIVDVIRRTHTLTEVRVSV